MLGTTTPCPISETVAPAYSSTLVRDHRGKNLCFREVGCLAKCPNPTQAQLGRAHGGSGGAFPSQMRCWIGRERFRGPECTPGRFSFTHLLFGFQRGRFQLRAVFSQGLSPARGCFQPGAVSNQGLFPARGCFQPGACDNFEGFVPQ